LDRVGPGAFANDPVRRIMSSGGTHRVARGPHSVRARASSAKKIGVALAGGGPLGGIYDVGALLAPTDSLEGVDLNALDVSVGVSSGSFVAAALANGISPAQMYRLFIDDGADATLAPALFLRPAFGEFLLRALSVPRLFSQAMLEYLRQPRRRSLLESLAILGRVV